MVDGFQRTSGIAEYYVGGVPYEVGSANICVLVLDLASFLTTFIIRITICWSGKTRSNRISSFCNW